MSVWGIGRKIITQNCAVLYIVSQLYTIKSTHMSSSYRCIRFSLEFCFICEFCAFFLPRASFRGVANEGHGCMPPVVAGNFFKV